MQEIVYKICAYVTLNHVVLETNMIVEIAMTREEVFEKLTEVFQDVFDDDSIVKNINKGMKTFCDMGYFVVQDVVRDESSILPF